MNDESEYGSNDNLFEMSRNKEGLGEEIQGREMSSSESRKMDTARSNKLTEKQASPDIVMTDYDEQAQVDNSNPVKTPRDDEPGEDEHDVDEFNSWPATKSTGNDDNTSTKYFHKSTKPKVIRERNESGGSTRPTRSGHAPEIGSIRATCGQSRENMWEGGVALDSRADRPGVPRAVVQSPPLWRGPRPPDQTRSGAKGGGQWSPGGEVKLLLTCKLLGEYKTRETTLPRLKTLRLSKHLNIKH